MTSCLSVIPRRTTKSFCILSAFDTCMVKPPSPCNLFPHTPWKFKFWEFHSLLIFPLPFDPPPATIGATIQPHPLDQGSGDEWKGKVPLPCLPVRRKSPFYTTKDPVSSAPIGPCFLMMMERPQTHCTFVKGERHSLVVCFVCCPSEMEGGDLPIFIVFLAHPSTLFPSHFMTPVLSSPSPVTIFQILMIGQLSPRLLSYAALCFTLPACLSSYFTRF